MPLSHNQFFYAIVTKQEKFDVCFAFRGVLKVSFGQNLKVLAKYVNIYMKNTEEKQTSWTEHGREKHNKKPRLIFPKR
jgi:hypothetical protein